MTLIMEGFFFVPFEAVFRDPFLKKDTLEIGQKKFISYTKSNKITVSVITI